MKPKALECFNSLRRRNFSEIVQQNFFRLLFSRAWDSLILLSVALASKEKKMKAGIPLLPLRESPQRKEIGTADS